MIYVILIGLWVLYIYIYGMFTYILDHLKIFLHLFIYILIENYNEKNYTRI